MRLLIAICVPAVFAASAGAVEQPSRFEATQYHMGTKFKVIVYSADEQLAAQGMKAAFARIKQLDEKLSDYESDSELSQLSLASPTRTPVKVSDDLWRVLEHAQQLSQRTDGAFDVTVGPVTKLWRRARRKKELPPIELLAEARSAVGFSYITLDAKEHTAKLSRPNMRLDLGGIAKGYAADQALSELKVLGLNHALIDAGGDLLLGDPPPGERGWQVGVARLQADELPTEVLRLANCGVATSGDVWQYVEIAGRRYSHIVDPRTGLGLNGRSSVTVIAPSGMQADALASAVSVLGAEKGIALIDQTCAAEAVFLRGRQNDVETFKSRCFSKFVEANR